VIETKKPLDTDNVMVNLVYLDGQHEYGDATLVSVIILNNIGVAYQYANTGTVLMKGVDSISETNKGSISQAFEFYLLSYNFVRYAWYYS
jgi:hypothetical protein